MNQVSIIGNLTRDLELRTTPGGTSVTTMRVAVNDRKPDASGQWVDVPYYFDAVVWGAKAENCAKFLSKGSKVGISGKLTWREWQAQDGTNRQSVEINAFEVDFLTPRSENSGGSNQYVPATPAGDFTPGADDDIPF